MPSGWDLNQTQCTPSASGYLMDANPPPIYQPVTTNHWQHNQYHTSAPQLQAISLSAHHRSQSATALPATLVPLSAVEATVQRANKLIHQLPSSELFFSGDLELLATLHTWYHDDAPAEYPAPAQQVTSDSPRCSSKGRCAVFGLQLM